MALPISGKMENIFIIQYAFIRPVYQWVRMDKKKVKLQCSVCWYDSPGDGVGVVVGNTLEDVGVGFVVLGADLSKIEAKIN